MQFTPKIFNYYPESVSDCIPFSVLNAQTESLDISIYDSEKNQYPFAIACDICGEHKERIAHITFVNDEQPVGYCKECLSTFTSELSEVLEKL